MANEISVRVSLQITKNQLRYQSQPTGFRADMNGNNGPTPGAVEVSVNGTDISLTQLSAMGGWCRIQNLDSTNYVEIGVEAAGVFYPLLELKAGEVIVVRLSRHVQQEAVGTGTYTGSTTLRMRAEGGPVLVLVEAFDA